MGRIFIGSEGRDPLQTKIGRVFEKLASMEKPMLVMVNESDVVCVKSGTFNFERQLNSPSAQDRIVGVYDWTVDQRDLAADIKDTAAKLGISYA